MKIKDILASHMHSVSFEVFPPRKDAPYGPVKEAVARLALQRPSFMSVTYGASGNAQANTVAIASFVQSCGVPALAHLTCLAATRDRIASEISALREAGIENVLCLRGDMPKDAVGPSPACFPHAVDLVRAMRPSAFCLGGACYPECHPECPHMEDDIRHLREKVDAGLDFITTQMFFDNNIFYRYLSKLRGGGVTVFSRETPTTLVTNTPAVRGQVLATAPSDGVALISSADYGRRDLRCPAVVQYCLKGESIRAPTSDDGGLKVTFFPFIGKEQE